MLKLAPLELLPGTVFTPEPPTVEEQVARSAAAAIWRTLDETVPTCRPSLLIFDLKSKSHRNLETVQNCSHEDEKLKLSEKSKLYQSQILFG